LIVAAAAVAVFFKSLDHQFVNWDDDVYVTANPVIQPLSPQRIGSIFSSFYYYAYIPITILSHAVDVALWGLKPRGHHLTNVLLHAANAVWVFLLGLALLRRAPGRGDDAPAGRGKTARPVGANDLPLVIGAFVAAVLFAVHPLRAESVSWISDRKDLLCAFFFLPAVAAYVTYASRRSRPEGRPWYLASFVLFLLAVLSKSIAVVFPALALLLDWLWIRERTVRPARLVLEKVPFLLVSLVLAALSLAMSPDGNGKRAYAIADLTRLEMVLFPFYSLTFSLYKTLLPIHLQPIYPRVGLGWMVAGLVVVLALTALCVFQAKRGRKAMLLAWLSYLLLLVPNVAGLSSGMQPVADRYSYLSTIGLYILVGAAVAWGWEKGSGKGRLALAVCSAALLLVFARATVSQAAHWKSSTSLWEHVIASAPPKRDYVDAYLNLGTAYAEERRPIEAREILERALAIDPANAEVLYNLGILSYMEGNAPKALEFFRHATRADPRHERAFYNLAIVSDELRRDEEAIAAMIQAARLGNPDAQDALRSRGIPW
jgi:tetratricopeptide (TPR) repeat protein